MRVWEVQIGIYYFKFQSNEKIDWLSRDEISLGYFKSYLFKLLSVFDRRWRAKIPSSWDLHPKIFRTKLGPLAGELSRGNLSHVRICIIKKEILLDITILKIRYARCRDGCSSFFSHSISFSDYCPDFIDLKKLWNNWPPVDSPKYSKSLIGRVSWFLWMQNKLQN